MSGWQGRGEAALVKLTLMTPEDARGLAAREGPIVAVVAACSDLVAAAMASDDTPRWRARLGREIGEMGLALVRVARLAETDIEVEIETTITRAERLAQSHLKKLDRVAQHAPTLGEMGGVYNTTGAT